MSVTIKQTITLIIEHDFIPDVELELTEAQARAIRDQLNEVLRDEQPKISFPPGVRREEAIRKPFIWPPTDLYNDGSGVSEDG